MHKEGDRSGCVGNPDPAPRWAELAELVSDSAEHSERGLESQRRPQRGGVRRRDEKGR